MGSSQDLELDALIRYWKVSNWFLLAIGRDANASKEALFEFIAQKLQGFEVILVDDPQPTHKHDVKMVGVIVFNR